MHIISHKCLLETIKSVCILAYPLVRPCQISLPQCVLASPHLQSVTVCLLLAWTCTVLHIAIDSHATEGLGGIDVLPIS